MVVSEGDIISSGTAWFVSRQHVVTAFHVVGAGSEWLTARREAPRLFVMADGTPHGLEPVSKDDGADVALLRLLDWDAPDDDIAELAPRLFTGLPWTSTGYPELNDHRPFVMSGDVVALMNRGRHA